MNKQKSSFDAEFWLAVGAGVVVFLILTAISGR
jgi:hypothetical protein